MVSGKQQNNNGGFIKGKSSFAGVILLIAGIGLAVFFLGQQTQWFNHAAAPTLPSQAVTNLNSTTDTLATINPDGTMGPLTSRGNWSNSLPTFLKGNLVFAVTDPPQAGKPSNPGNKGEKPTESVKPTEINPTIQVSTSQVAPTAAQRHGPGNGPQTVTALNLTTKKVEVHLASVGKFKDPDVATPSGTVIPSISPSEKGQPVDHWETLTITSPLTVDLVALAKTKDFSALGLTTLAEGRYTEIRLYVSSATATLADGTTVVLQIPGKNNIVRVIHPFIVTAGQTTQITMDFDAQHSVIKTGNGYILKPVIARLIKEH